MTKQIHSFLELGIAEDLIENLKAIGFEKPTQIQSQGIPELINGKRDLLAIAQTGTGKTACFGLPIIQNTDPDNPEPQTLILTPTRELAKQIADEIHRLKGKRRLSIIAVYGGQSFETQTTRLRKGVQIIAATPGRVLDLLNRNKISFDHLKHIVLDEADEMLNMGFIDDINAILRFAPKKRRTLLFSATLPKKLVQIVDQHLSKDKLEINLQATNLTTTLVNQIYYEVFERDKFEVLKRVIASVPSFFGVIFCRTKQEANDINTKLQNQHYRCEALHGDIGQNQREKTIGNFRRGRLKILVATDVAARGIDVEAVSHVINYSLPRQPETYVHRIGRTGRANKEGTAISFVSPSEQYLFNDIQNFANTKIVKEPFPNTLQILEAQKKKIYEEIEVAIAGQKERKTKMPNHYQDLCQDLLSRYPGEVALTAILQMTYRNLNENSFREIEIPKPFRRLRKAPRRDHYPTGRYEKRRPFPRRSVPTQYKRNHQASR